MHFYKTDIPSEWPSSVPKKGFANILLSFVALSALWYYLALEKGWSAVGHLTTEDVGSWVKVCILTIDWLKFMNVDIFITKKQKLENLKVIQ